MIVIKAAGPRPWVGVERRHLATFATVAAEGSFRAAARSLGYSQAAVSQHVAELEQMLGTRLVERHSGPAAVTLTRAGELLLDHVGPILSRFVAAQADLAAAGTRPRIGVSASVAARLLPPALAAVALRHADTQLDIAEPASDEELARLVETGDIDLAVGGPPRRRGPFEIRRLGADPYVLATPGSWALAHRDGRVLAEELERLPLVARAGASSDGHLDGELRAQGVEPRYVATASSAQAALAFVTAGAGAAIVPAMSVPGWDARVTPVPLGGLVAPRAVCAYRHSDRRLSAATEAFADAAAEACAALADGSPALHPVA